MKIRSGNLVDMAQLQQIFVGSVNFVCVNDYDEKQLAAWSAGVENSQRWHDMLNDQYVLIAEEGYESVGFCTLKDENYIDFLYVHQDFQRRGVASALYQSIENEALRCGQTELFADVSKTAKGFFERKGFIVLREQIVAIRGESLTNFRMQKILP